MQKEKEKKYMNDLQSQKELYEKWKNEIQQKFDSEWEKHWKKKEYLESKIKDLEAKRGSL